MDESSEGRGVPTYRRGMLKAKPTPSLPRLCRCIPSTALYCYWPQPMGPPGAQGWVSDGVPPLLPAVGLSSLPCDGQRWGRRPWDDIGRCSCSLCVPGGEHRG